jgi:hypothetical protein
MQKPFHPWIRLFRQLGSVRKGVRPGVFNLCLSRAMSLIPFLFRGMRPHPPRADGENTSASLSQTPSGLSGW